MSRLGAAGWTAVGRRWADVLFWIFVLGVVWLLLWWIHFVLFMLGWLVPVQKVLEQILFVLTIILLIGSVGVAGFIGYAFIKDLGHNFYAVWKTAGAGAAARGLIADIKACGTGLINGLVSKTKEYVGPIIGAAKKMFGW